MALMPPVQESAGPPPYNYKAIISVTFLVDCTMGMTDHQVSVRAGATPAAARCSPHWHIMGMQITHCKQLCH